MLKMEQLLIARKSSPHVVNVTEESPRATITESLTVGTNFETNVDNLKFTLKKSDMQKIWEIANEIEKITSNAIAPLQSDSCVEDDVSELLDAVVETVQASDTILPDDSQTPNSLPKVKSKRSANKGNVSFPCAGCEQVFTKTQDLFSHTCAKKTSEGFMCEHCFKIYKLRSTYVNHKIIHSKVKPYVCGLCGKKSSQQSNHLQHMRNMHPLSKLFPCQFCLESFMSRKEQKSHLKTHLLLEDS